LRTGAVTGHGPRPWALTHYSYHGRLACWLVGGFMTCSDCVVQYISNITAPGITVPRYLPSIFLMYFGKSYAYTLKFKPRESTTPPKFVLATWVPLYCGPHESLWVTVRSWIVIRIISTPLILIAATNKKKGQLTFLAEYSFPHRLLLSSVCGYST
jgi:hypothetical protein